MKFKETVGSVDLFAQAMTVPVKNTSAAVIPVGTVVMIDVTNWQNPVLPVDEQPYIPVVPAVNTAAGTALSIGVVIGNDLPVAPNSAGPFIAGGPGIGQVACYGIVSVLKSISQAWVGGELLTVGATGQAAINATPAPGEQIGIALPCAVITPAPTIAYGDMFFTKF